MIKKIIAAAIASAISLSAVTALAAVNFSDLGKDHWAYAPVSVLVDEGTVKGYEDGSFLPDNVVTRAEFLKMIGKGETVNYEKDFQDVPKNHWAYDYIMTSSLAEEGEKFEPDKPITRGETVTQLWERAGNKTASAPDFIKKQATYSAPVEWIYSFGIMVGNDGIDLRLGDTISRAEAAALIIKSRESKTPKDFVDNVPAQTLELMYNNANLFDKMPYEPDKTITNGEMARAMIRFATNEQTVKYDDYYTKELFEHEYAKDLYVLGNEVIGVDKITAEFADKKATLGDTISAFNVSMARRTHSDKKFNLPLYISQNADKPVTLKDIAAMVILYDEQYGTRTAFTTDKDEEGYYITEHVSMVKSIDKMPENYNKFMAIIKDIPLEVYTSPFGTADEKYGIPKEKFGFAVSYATLFAGRCEKIVAKVKETADIKITYYPELVYDSGEGFSYRVKCDFVTGTTKTAKEVFGDMAITNKDDVMNQGAVCYLEIKDGYAIFE